MSDNLKGIWPSLFMQAFLEDGLWIFSSNVCQSKSWLTMKILSWYFKVLFPQHNFWLCDWNFFFFFFAEVGVGGFRRWEDSCLSLSLAWTNFQVDSRTWQLRGIFPKSFISQKPEFFFRVYLSSSSIESLHHHCIHISQYSLAFSL